MGTWHGTSNIWQQKRSVLDKKELTLEWVSIINCTLISTHATEKRLYLGSAVAVLVNIKTITPLKIIHKWY